VLVDPADPAFLAPTSSSGRYIPLKRRQLRASVAGWRIAAAWPALAGVVSAVPKGLWEIPDLRGSAAVEAGVVVICAVGVVIPCTAWKRAKAWSVGRHRQGLASSCSSGGHWGRTAVGNL